jgi:hypothetical protein
LSSLVQQHPLACFFVLTYLAAWCLWAPLVIFRDTLAPAAGFILGLLGSLVPSTVAIVLVAVIHGSVAYEAFSAAWSSGASDFAGTRWY